MLRRIIKRIIMVIKKKKPVIHIKYISVIVSRQPDTGTLAQYAFNEGENTVGKRYGGRGRFDFELSKRAFIKTTVVRWCAGSGRLVDGRLLRRPCASDRTSHKLERWQFRNYCSPFRRATSGKHDRTAFGRTSIKVTRRWKPIATNIPESCPHTSVRRIRRTANRCCPRTLDRCAFVFPRLPGIVLTPLKRRPSSPTSLANYRPHRRCRARHKQSNRETNQSLRTIIHPSAIQTRYSPSDDPRTDDRFPRTTDIWRAR